MLPNDLLKIVISFLSINEYLLFKITSKKLNNINDINLSYVYSEVKTLNYVKNYKINKLYFFVHNSSHIEYLKNMNFYKKLILEIFLLHDDFNYLTGIKNLSKLILPSLYPADQKHVINLLKNYNINTLRFTCREKLIDEINNITNIKYLQLLYEYDLFPNFKEISSEAKIRITKLIFYRLYGNLKFKEMNKNIFNNLKLTIESCLNLNDENIFDLKNFPIVFLKISDSYKITGQSINYINEFSNLKTLYLLHCPRICDRELEKLKNSSITKLTLSLSITHNGLDFLELMELKTLNLYNMIITMKILNKLIFFGKKKKINIHLISCNMSTKIYQKINNYNFITIRKNTNYFLTKNNVIIDFN